MARYFIELAYNGIAFSGWQRQPHSPSVQQTIEDALGLMLRTPTPITGCGRTDTGVHADDYYAHFDYDGLFPKGFVARLNRFLPREILIKAIYAVSADSHTRFDATSRAYRYEIGFAKDPFRLDTVTVFPFKEKTKTELLHQTAELITQYTEFTPFCKTNSDAKTMNCVIHGAHWDIREDGWTFHISANRFLRGMVRLIVGTCLEVGQGKLELSEVRQALDEQRQLSRAWSAPAAGLFLTCVQYDGKKNWKNVQSGI